jgi:crossover junction endodeoxyribonuclease RuvC
MNIIGIDPGARGAIARYVNGRVDAILDMPTTTHKGKLRVNGAALARALRDLSPALAFLENVHSMPKQGVASTFAFGRAMGIVEGVLGALSVPFTLITPAEWKVAMRVPADKDGARARASQLIPSCAHHWPLVKHDGRAEAAMIALYGAEHSNSLAVKQNRRLAALPIEW